MGATKAQRTRKGRKNYGLNYERGRTTEAKIARSLQRQGYKATLSPGSRGYDVTARKGGDVRKIQVKHISSRSFKTPEAARNRVKIAPYNIKRIAPGTEVWIVDKNGKTRKFKR